MATEDNISIARSHCDHYFSEVLSQNVQPSLRNLKLKHLCTFTVTMTMVAILKKVNIRKALPHEGCHYCEVSLQKVQPSLREMKLKKCKQFRGYHGNATEFFKPVTANSVRLKRNCYGPSPEFYEVQYSL